MSKRQNRSANVIWGICTNTGGKADGTPCIKCQNKEKQAIRSSKDFVCEECGEPLTKIPTPTPPTPWPRILCIAIAVIGLLVGGYFLFRNHSKVQITVISSDETMGTTKGGGAFDPNTTILIEAVPNEGYVFDSWDDGDTANPREIEVSKDDTITAIFKMKMKDSGETNLTIEVKSSDETRGIVKGGGTFAPGTDISFEALSKEGYMFVSWDDGDTSNPRTIVVSKDESFTARFEKNPVATVVIEVKPLDETMGTAKGGGTFAQFTTITIEALPKDGYEFEKWDDGNIENPRDVITGRDKTYLAKFRKKTSGPNKGTIHYSFGKYVGEYVGELKNGIPEGDGKFYYTCRVQIAKHDTDNPPHYAEAGDWFEGTWGNGDIVSGALYSKDGKIKEKIFAPKRFNPYDLHKEQCQ